MIHEICQVPNMVEWEEGLFCLRDMASFPTSILTLRDCGSDSFGEGGGGGRFWFTGSSFSLNIDFNFLMLCVGARPLSLVKLSEEINMFSSR